MLQRKANAGGWKKTMREEELCCKGKPTLVVVEVRLDDENLEGKRVAAAADAGIGTGSPSSSADSKLETTAVLLDQFDCNPSLATMIGFKINN